jgi:hypothetical protein
VPTKGVRRYAWSPDGREVAVALDDRIVVVPLNGAPPSTIEHVSAHDLVWTR